VAVVTSACGAELPTGTTTARNYYVTFAYAAVGSAGLSVQACLGDFCTRAQASDSRSRVTWEETHTMSRTELDASPIFRMLVSGRDRCKPSRLEFTSRAFTEQVLETSCDGAIIRIELQLVPLP
jgi:hypothetical protein